MTTTQPAPDVVILDRDELHPLAASNPDGPFYEMLEDIYDDDDRYEPWEVS